MLFVVYHKIFLILSKFLASYDKFFFSATDLSYLLALSTGSLAYLFGGEGSFVLAVEFPGSTECLAAKSIRTGHLVDLHHRFCAVQT